MVDKLVETILNMPNNKILTLLLPNEPFVVDVNQPDLIGYCKEHHALFLAKLNTALAENGVLIIRQFTDIKVEREVSNGKTMWIPRKKVYGVVFRDGNWFSIDPDALKESFSKDCQTGKAIEPELDVIYCDFSDVYKCNCKT